MCVRYHRQLRAREEGRRMSHVIKINSRDDYINLEDESRLDEIDEIDINDCE